MSIAAIIGLYILTSLPFTFTVAKAIAFGLRPVKPEHSEE
jgi:hypothetical protein